MLCQPPGIHSRSCKEILYLRKKYPLSLEEIAAGVRELPYIKQRYTRIRIFHFHFFMNVFMNSPLRKFRFHLLHGSHALMPHGPVPEPYAQSPSPDGPKALPGVTITPVFSTRSITKASEDFILLRDRSPYKHSCYRTVHFPANGAKTVTENISSCLIAFMVS